MPMDNRLMRPALDDGGVAPQPSEPLRTESNDVITTEAGAELTTG